MKCPNKNDQDWKNIVTKYGEDTAYAAYIRNGEEIPPLSYVDDLLGDPAEEIAPSREREIKYLESIRTSIADVLETMGVGIGVLEEYEKRSGIDGVNVNGVFDPTSSRKTAEGLAELIRIADGHRGLQALPEEFSHLVDSVLIENDSPLYKRLTDLLKNEEVVKEFLERESPGSYDNYMALYGGNKDLIAAEARAKMIAKHIIKNEPLAPRDPWTSLFSRIKQLFSRIFGKGNISIINDAIAKAEREYSQFTADLMGGKVQMNFSLDSPIFTHKLYNVTSSVSKSEEVFRKMLETEHKRLSILSASSKLTEEQQIAIDRKDAILNKFEFLKNEERYDEGILDFMHQVIADTEGLISQFRELNLSKGISATSIPTIAKFLRDMKGVSNAYKPILEDLVDLTTTQEYKDQDLFDFSEPLKELGSLMARIDSEYKNAARPLFSQYIKQFTGSLIGSTIKGVTVDNSYIDNLLVMSEKDISFMDKWLFSMTESSDLMLRLYERPIKNAKFLARDKAIAKVTELQKAQEDLEKAGYKTDFVYARKDGKLTGEYIKELDWNTYYQDKNAFEKSLNEKYGVERGTQWWAEYNAWKNAHTERDANDKLIPRKSLYTNSMYETLAPAQKTFLDKVVSIKKELDSLLPDNKISPYLLPQIRKDFLERALSSKSAKELAGKIGSGIKDSWVERESDDEFGSRYSLQDFDGTTFNTLPIYYTQKLDDMTQLSTDVVSSMAMYADMAYTYDAMNKVVDIMEVGKDLLRDRTTLDSKGGKGLVEVIKQGGRTIENKITKRKGNTRIDEKLQEFLEAQMYGQYSKDEGTFKIPLFDVQISVAKAAGNINAMTAMNTYALNLLSGAANVTMGSVMLRIEAMSRQFFDMKDLANADLIYGKSLPGVLSQIGTRRKTNKFDLMMIKYNVFQDHEERMRSIEMNKKHIAARLFNSSALFFANNCGEHYLQSRTFLALAHKMKLKDASGKEISLWDAYQVEVDSRGIEVVTLKDGVTKLDGTDFDMSDVEKLSRKSARINQMLHGIYNKEDKSAFHRYAVGKLVMMFKNWMVSSWNRRFQGENYNFDLDEKTEGFYAGTFNFISQLAKDLKEGRLDIALHWSKMSHADKANILRAIGEVSAFIGVVIAYSLLSGAWEDDDEWIKVFMLYQLRRLQTELGVFIPTGYTQAKEGLKLFQQPAAGIGYMDNLLGILAVWDIARDPLQSGLYEGWNPYARNWVRNAPFINPVQKFLNPDSSLKFYTSDR